MSTRHLIRKTIEKLFPTDSDLTAFIVDYFPDVYRQISNGMDVTTKINVLLSKKQEKEICAALEAHLQDIEQHSSEIERPFRPRRRRFAKKLRWMILGAMAMDHFRDFMRYCFGAIVRVWKTLLLHSKVSLYAIMAFSILLGIWIINRPRHDEHRLSDDAMRNANDGSFPDLSQGAVILSASSDMSPSGDKTERNYGHLGAVNNLNHKPIERFSCDLDLKAPSLWAGRWYPSELPSNVPFQVEELLKADHIIGSFGNAESEAHRRIKVGEVPKFINGKSTISDPGSIAVCLTWEAAQVGDPSSESRCSNPTLDPEERYPFDFPIVHIREAISSRPRTWLSLRLCAAPGSFYCTTLCSIVLAGSIPDND